MFRHPLGKLKYIRRPGAQGPAKFVLALTHARSDLIVFRSALNRFINKPVYIQRYEVLLDSPVEEFEYIPVPSSFLCSVKADRITYNPPKTSSCAAGSM